MPSDHEWPAPTVGALLRLAWLEFRRQADERVQRAGYDDLSAAHILLFRYPTIEGMRPGQLAEQAGMSKQSVNDLLRQLESLGYVGRGERDPTDGRARLITLTERGRGLMDALYATSAELAGEWAAMLGQERFDAFRDTLLTLVHGSPAPADADDVPTTGSS